MIKSFLKGVVIGIANVVPGVSGGTMMVSMGIYDKLIHCITHLFSEFKKSVIFLFPIAVGMATAIVAGSFGLKLLFKQLPVQTNLLFIGLILGGLPAIWSYVKGKSVKAGHLATYTLFLALVVGMAMIGKPAGTGAELTFGWVNALKLFAVGVIASATMVIPGVSGSMVLMLMGFYQPVIDTITELFTALTDLNMDGILQACGILIPFGLGIVTGIFVVAKVVEIVFEKCPLYAYWAIIGLLVASPAAIWLMMLKEPAVAVTPLDMATGLVALVVGYVAATKLGE